MEPDAEPDVYYIEPYDGNDPRIEPRPDTVIYQAIFAELRKLNQKCGSKLRNPFQESQYQNVITKALLQDVLNRLKLECSEEVMFAIVGDKESGECSADMS